MALIRGCSRCGTGVPVVTRIADFGVVVEVRLCPVCREQAAAENDAARARSTGTDPVPGAW